MTIACNFPHCFFQNRPAGILPHVQSPSATKRRRARHGSNPANIALESSTVFTGRISVGNTIPTTVFIGGQIYVANRFSSIQCVQPTSGHRISSRLRLWYFQFPRGSHSNVISLCLKMFYSAGKPNFPRVDNSDPDAFGITVFQRREVCDPCGDRRP